MPSEQVYSALNLQVSLSKYQIVPFPLIWDPACRVWRLYNGKNPLKVNLKFSLLFMWKTIVCALLIVAFHLARTNNEFSLEHIFGCLLSFQIIASSLVSDICMFSFGQDLVSNSNCRFKMEESWSEYQLKNRKSIESYNHLIIFIFVFLTVCSLSYLMAFVGTMMNWDPLHVLLIGTAHLILERIEVPFLRTILVWNSQLFPGKVVRVVVVYVLAHMAFTSVRVTFVLGCTSGSVMLILQKMLMESSLESVSIIKYRQLQIDRNVLFEVEKVMVTAIFGTCGFCLQGSIVALTICLTREQYLIAAASAILALGCLLLLMMAMYIFCLVNDLSLQTLTRWKRQLSKIKSMKYLRRVVKSCRPLAFPAGDVGIVNKELKINFFQAELMNTINFLTAFNDFIQK